MAKDKKNQRNNTAPTSAIAFSSLCVLGRPSTSLDENERRIELCRAALSHVSGVGGNAALIMPGGMFFHDEALAPLSPAARREAVSESEWAQHLSSLLTPQSGTVICGLDVGSAKDGEPHGQYSIALTHEGVQAVSRKIFPTKGEVQKGAFTQARDYADNSRFVAGDAAQPSLVLHTCYDLFGSVDALSGKESPSRLSHVPAPKNQTKRTCYETYSHMINQHIAGHTPLVSVNIHDFERPGRDIFYQRHGIASASAAFNGAVVIGGAHFEAELPRHEGSSTLCAAHVPPSHLSAHYHRQAHMMKAAKHHPICTKTAQGLLRRFKI